MVEPRAAPRAEAPAWQGATREHCPLCIDSRTSLFHRDRARSYWRCRTCALVFVPAVDHPAPAAEKARYDQHRNDPADPRYRAFLDTLAAPLLTRVAPGSRGLDFGCGPGPALAAMLREAGMDVDLYDVFYAADERVWKRKYDFVTATEVFEHLHQPGREIDRLLGVIRPGGWLAVMTRWVDSIPSFDNSRYVRDPTHVCFYGRATFDWIAARRGARAEFPADDVALLRTAA